MCPALTSHLLRSQIFKQVLWISGSTASLTARSGAALTGLHQHKGSRHFSKIAVRWD